MKAAGVTPPRVVAISVSESPDMAVLGLSNDHLEDAMCEIAMYLLADGADLAYGGDLRPGGFTEMLFEMLLRYRSGADATRDGSLTNYLAWPVHIRMAKDTINETTSALRCARLALMGRDGRRVSIEERLEMRSYEPEEKEWSEGLTAMRRTMCAETDARVVLGGKVAGYKGSMPGVAEEVLLSLESRQPVFLIGGFGGCAGDVAWTLGLSDSPTGSLAGSRPTGADGRLFERYGPDNLRNGLSLEENMFLAKSSHIGQAVALVLRGLHRLRKGVFDDERDGGEQSCTGP